jgi:hypothetical protein
LKRCSFSSTTFAIAPCAYFSSDTGAIADVA